MNRLTSTAIAALLAAPFAIAQPALAQSSEDTSSGSDMSTSSDSDTSTQSDSSTSSGSDQSGMGGSDMSSSGEADAVVVSVGDSDIMASDVTAAISALPPQMQETPPEQLIPFAVEQLVLRELILQDAEEQGITGEEAADQTEMAQENATIEAYLNQQMEGVVTDETVQDAYDEVESGTEEELPPLEAVRPQIEQQLRQQRLAELREDLMEDTEIVYYGPDGEPRETMGANGASSQGGMSSSTGGETSSDSGMSSGSGSSNSGMSSGSSTDSDSSSSNSGSSSASGGMSSESGSSDAGGSSDSDMTGGESTESGSDSDGSESEDDSSSN